MRNYNVDVFVISIQSLACFCKVFAPEKASTHVCNVPT